MTLSVIFDPYHFVRAILSIPFCPMPFCPYTILSIPFCPYHFVRYHFVLEPLQQKVKHHFKFPVSYDRIFISMTSQALDPSPRHKLPHLLRPFPLERGRPPKPGGRDKEREAGDGGRVSIMME